MNEFCPQHRALSIFPYRLGFSYAILEGTSRLVDWDVAQLGKNSDEEFCRRAEAVIERYKPTVVAFEDYSNTRRGEKGQRRIEAVLSAAKFRDLTTVLISAGDIRSALRLPSSATKHDVADRLIELFPELARKTPKKQIWQRDPRMNLFDAVALSFAANR